MKRSDRELAECLIRVLDLVRGEPDPGPIGEDESLEVRRIQTRYLELRKSHSFEDSARIARIEGIERLLHKLR